jgi:PAS domain S-box-containing protein
MEIKKTEENKKKIEKKEEIERLREDLEDLENYIEEFSNFLPLGVCTLNLFGVVVDANQAFSSLSKYQIFEIAGKPLREFFLEKEEIEKILKEVVKKKTPLFREMTLISKDNKRIPVKVAFSIRKEREGRFVGYFIGITDISELKELQEKLEEKVKEKTQELYEKIKELERITEERAIILIRERALKRNTEKKSKELEKKTKELEELSRALMNILEDIDEEKKKVEEEKNKTLAIITNFTDGLLMFDQEEKLVLINPQAEFFLGINAKEVTGKSISELIKIPQVEKIIKIIKEGNQKVFRKEVKIKEELILEVTTVSVMRGRVKAGDLIILHDITREKAIERMKTEFVSIAAHQLRTPISAIKWTLRMILDGDLGEISKEQKDFIEKIYQSNERMINLINDLLNVARIEEGRYLYSPTIGDLGVICEKIISSYKEEIERRGLELKFERPKKLPKVMLDVEKISLAIQNLIENAIFYNVPGGKIEISLKPKEKEIEFSIKDTGIGIPKEQHNRVFTKFFRSTNAIKVKTEGSGLGLFITKNIIEAHRGKIWFESEEGKGTTFHFTLPTIGG